MTEADKGGERAIRAIIDRERPDDAILGEEYGEKAGLPPTAGAGCWIRWMAPAPSSPAGTNGAR